MSGLSLHRKGAWLKGHHGDESHSWQMSSVHGPLSLESSDREYFRVETTSREVLLVSRRLGEKGMRELRLDSVLSKQQEDRSSFAS
jgi:hypothetical protein